MLILLPPSESKKPPPDRGTPIDLTALSFPELTGVRTSVLEALIATSSRGDALDRLLVGQSIAGEVRRNVEIERLPTRRAIETYRGALFDALQAETLPKRQSSRPDSSVVIVSSLWGALRPDDPIPPYRLHLCSNLVGLIPLEPLWRSVLGPVLADAAGGRGAMVDLRSSSYQAVGMPDGIANRTVTMRVMAETGTRGASGYVSKRTRGAIARFLLESGAEPDTPQDVSDLLEGRWSVELSAPKRPKQPWQLTVTATAIS